MRGCISISRRRGAIPICRRANERAAGNYFVARPGRRHRCDRHEWPSWHLRHVLVPITLAIILSLLISSSRRPAAGLLGMGSTSSVLAAVVALALLFASVATVMGVQVARMAASLPQYEQTIRHKLATVDEMTVSWVNGLTGHARRLWEQRSEPRAAAAPTAGPPPQGIASTAPLAAAPSAAAPSPAAPIPWHRTCRPRIRCRSSRRCWSSYGRR